MIGRRAERVRAAQAKDLEAVTAIWFAGWHDGHDGHTPVELARVRTEASFRHRAEARLGDTTVAEVGGAVAGFVVVRGDEIEQIFVASENRGTGVAERLLHAAAGTVAGAGYRRAWLAVACGNARARRFYERVGWRDDGAFQYAAESPGGPIAVPCHRYSSPVGNPQRPPARTPLSPGWVPLVHRAVAAMPARTSSVRVP